MKSEKGSITLYVLISMIFFLIITMTAYISASSKLQGQNAEIEQIKAAYEQDLSDEALLQLYNKATRTRQWLQGSGTKEDTYKIYTIEDLVEFSNLSKSKNFAGQYVELMNDLDFQKDSSYAKADRTDFGDINGNGTIETLKTELTTGEGFPSVGENTTAHAFSGIFLGENHEIKNIYIKNTKKTSVGLFAALNNCTIQDLGIIGTITTTVRAGTGAIAGDTISSATAIYIKNCYSKVNVISNSTSYSVGGLVGTSNGAINFSNCYNEGNISGGNNTGGIVGYINKTLVIDNCYNTGEISKGSYIGGIIGRDAATSNSTTITNSYNLGRIKGGSEAGGIFGRTFGTVNISDSYNEGTIIGASYAGGIIGRKYSGKPTITNSYNKNQVEGTYMVGGIAGDADNAGITNCGNEGNISAVRTDSSEGRIGGICGYSSGNIKCCYNTGNINATNTMNEGGIVGFYDTSSIENCYNTGDIIGEKSIGRMGGIVARNNNGATIKNCYSIGNISRTGNYYGGVVGYNYSPSIIINSYYLATKSNKTFYGSTTGVVNCTSKPEQEMKEAAFVTLLDTNNTESVWVQDTGNINKGYPVLKWQTK